MNTERAVVTVLVALGIGGFAGVGQSLDRALISNGQGGRSALRHSGGVSSASQAGLAGAAHFVTRFTEPAADVASRARRNIFPRWSPDKPITFGFELEGTSKEIFGAYRRPEYSDVAWDALEPARRSELVQMGNRYGGLVRRDDAPSWLAPELKQEGTIGVWEIVSEPIDTFEQLQERLNWARHRFNSDAFHIHVALPDPLAHGGPNTELTQLAIHMNEWLASLALWSKKGSHYLEPWTGDTVSELLEGSRPSFHDYKYASLGWREGDIYGDEGLVGLEFRAGGADPAKTYNAVDTVLRFAEREVPEQFVFRLGEGSVERSMADLKNSSFVPEVEHVRKLLQYRPHDRWLRKDMDILQRAALGLVPWEERPYMANRAQVIVEQRANLEHNLRHIGKIAADRDNRPSAGKLRELLNDVLHWWAQETAIHELF